MNNDDNFMHKYYTPFLSSNNHEDVSSVPRYDSEKRRVFRNKNIFFDLLLNKSKSFKWQVLLVFLI